ncbi:hypothetical protein [Agrococcus sp. ARC_14]|uniref:hypothetical protein n=1 Tax=Agrococcus sp. ARC_14 TaxID=2919927 RepID=UPI001F0555FB|nr:hypothetical protein [Agrococcus sp. ARC_14]MCH1881839.1 hypothetical protein [Agrococcus sp. ARC_14]
MSDNPRTPILRGANPAVQLFDGDEVVALASVWRVDESPMGSGTALILWHAGRVRVIGVDPGLSSWLSGRFVRHFPEAEGLEWSQVEVRTEDVEIELDLETGLVARAGSIEVRIDGPMGEREFTTDAFTLDGVDHGLSLRLVPCRRGSISFGGAPLTGEPRVEEDAERPQSTAFLAVDEVWSR